MHFNSTLTSLIFYFDIDLNFPIILKIFESKIQKIATDQFRNLDEENKRIFHLQYFSKTNFLFPLISKDLFDLHYSIDLKALKKFYKSKENKVKSYELRKTSTFYDLMLKIKERSSFRILEKYKNYMKSKEKDYFLRLLIRDFIEFYFPTNLSNIHSNW